MAHHPPPRVNSAASRGGAQLPPRLVREIIGNMLMHSGNTHHRGQPAYDGGDDDGLPKAVIARFLETTAARGEAMAADGGDPELCAVCLDDLRQDDRTVGVLDCRHSFHGDCIGKWLQKKNFCPLCKAIGIKVNRVRVHGL